MHGSLELSGQYPRCMLNLVPLAQERAAGCMNITAWTIGSKPPTAQENGSTDANSPMPVFWSRMTHGTIPPLDVFKKSTDRFAFKDVVPCFTSNRHPFEWCPGIFAFDKGALDFWQ